MPTTSPPSKRIRLADSPSSSVVEVHEGEDELVEDNDVEVVQEEEEDHCTICLQPKVDRTVLPTCSHEFCFECISVWCGEHDLIRSIEYSDAYP